jgi:hypothetical protein
MNNVVMFKIAVNSGTQQVSPTRLIASVTLSCPPTNTGTVYLKVGTGGAEVPWVPGEWHEFKNIDLSTLYVRGLAPDVITVIGGTW